MDEEEIENKKIPLKRDKQDKRKAALDKLMVEAGVELIDDDVFETTKKFIEKRMRKEEVVFNMNSLKSFTEGYTFGMLASLESDDTIRMTMLICLKRMIQEKKSEMDSIINKSLEDNGK